MNIFTLARMPLTGLQGEYLLTLKVRDVTATAVAREMTREALAAKIAGDPDRGRRVRAMAEAERRDRKAHEDRVTRVTHCDH